MASISIDSLAVCEDCAQIIANGEISAYEDNGAAVAAAQVAQWGEHAAHLVLGDLEGSWFSWESCEGCGSTLGGERHSACILTN